MPEAHSGRRVLPLLRGCAAVLFDLDGVLTPTASLHRQAWRELFAPLLDAEGVAAYTEDDYFEHIDGRPRYQGVAALLESRGLSRPWGDPGDPPGVDTVCALGNRKSALFTALLRTRGIRAYPGAIELLDALGREQPQTALAVVSSSRNTLDVLESAGLAHRFAVVIDGVVADDLGLAGKPNPDTFLLAARRLGVSPADSAVLEDSTSGVQAAATGGFHPVVGVDRGAGAPALRRAGADVVVEGPEGLLAPTRSKES